MSSISTRPVIVSLTVWLSIRWKTEDRAANIALCTLNSLSTSPTMVSVEANVLEFHISTVSFALNEKSTKIFLDVSITACSLKVSDYVRDCDFAKAYKRIFVFLLLHAPIGQSARRGPWYHTLSESPTPARERLLRPAECFFKIKDLSLSRTHGQRILSSSVLPLKTYLVEGLMQVKSAVTQCLPIHVVWNLKEVEGEVPAQVLFLSLING
ncbi:hypothetical protein TNCV_1470381 [Trichonephila clavipes]|nr:hypothetical protein TNCV_1470381 [Trichonephila clavipes]